VWRAQIGGGRLQCALAHIAFPETFRGFFEFTLRADARKSKV
jgi:hypothetical protein